MNSASLAGCSILVCEDEPLIALDIANALSNAGARVVSAYSLADALTALEAEVPVGRHPGSRAERWREFATPRIPKGAEHPARPLQWVPRRTGQGG
jgi:CheY-like chemotaxis protein